jgi:Fe-S cluster assembly iron-binding protein IscA
MFRIFRKKRGKGGHAQAGQVSDVQLRPVEKAGIDPLERRLGKTRTSLGDTLSKLFSPGVSLDEDLLEDDIVLAYDGVDVLVDPLSMQYLQDAEVDFKDDLQGSRFFVNNPNAETTCGCGSSFSI